MSCGPRLEVPALRTYLAGHEALTRALAQDEPLRVLLVGAGDESSPTRALVQAAEQKGVRIWRGGPGDLRRMARSSEPPSCIGMLGPSPTADLPELLGRGGVTFLLHRVAYPSNVGFAVRTAEVAGADGVVVDASFNHEERDRVLHVSMGASLMLPVLYEPSSRVLDLAAERHLPVVALEDVGTCAPWEVDLRGPLVCVVGGERHGIAPEVLARCSAVMRLPMAGFVPSYNFQGAMAAVAIERLRQLGSP